MIGPARFEVVERVGDAEWQEVADACPHATFFHTPLWSRAFAASEPAARVETLLVRFENGARAVFPLIRRRKAGGIWQAVESAAAFCYGGWISDRPLGEDASDALARFAIERFPNLAWRVNPLDPHLSLLNARSSVADTTEILDLAAFPGEQQLRMHYRHSARKQINKGARAGLVARIADDWREWEEYDAIYRTRLQQWGRAATGRFPISLFRGLHESRDPRVRLWVVCKDGRIVGGNLNFEQGRHCVEWHAAYDTSLFSIGVRDFLVDAIIQDARRRGFLHYDFNPSGGHEGTRRFKQTFGTDSRPAGMIFARRGIYRLAALRRLARAARALRARASGR